MLGEKISTFLLFFSPKIHKNLLGTAFMKTEHNNVHFWHRKFGIEIDNIWNRYRQTHMVIVTISNQKKNKAKGFTMETFA